MDENQIKEKIQQRQGQFLVHSFLFHELSESIIDDTTFDKWARTLYDMQKRYSDIAISTKYYNLTKNIGSDLSSEAMGLTRRDYPPNIVTTALRLLHNHKNIDEPFNTFVERYGYYITERGGGM